VVANLIVGAFDNVDFVFLCEFVNFVEAFRVSGDNDNQICDHCDILLGDSMGEMMNYFDIANVVFMGGSLVKTGGHNMLEPAAVEAFRVSGDNDE
jgi:3-deoxy-D-manno-octulosonic-acid transferase